MNRKAVFFDIDGTLWDWKYRIPDSTREAMRRLHANGHLAFICSGRAKGNIREPALMSLGFDGFVAACGGYVEVDEKVIFETVVSHDAVRRTIEAVQECKMPVVLEGPQKHWVSEWGFCKDEYVDELHRVMGSDAIELIEYSDDIHINKFAADVLVMTDYKGIKERLGDYFHFIEHGLTPDLKYDPNLDPSTIIAVIEAVPHGIDKSVGVRRTCEYLGIDISDTYAFGDSANDIEMFEAVGHGICMGNGTEAARKAAEYVTADIHEDGLYKALEHYGLI